MDLCRASPVVHRVSDVEHLDPLTVIRLVCDPPAVVSQRHESPGRVESGIHVVTVVQTLLLVFSVAEGLLAKVVDAEVGLALLPSVGRGLHHSPATVRTTVRVKWRFRTDGSQKQFIWNFRCFVQCHINLGDIRMSIAVSHE